LDKQGLTVVSCPDLFAGIHLLTAHAKTCERMLRHRAPLGTIAEWYAYCTPLDLARGLRILRKSAENLR